MAGKVELLTPSNGKVALVGEDTATDVTVTVPAGTDTLLNTSSDIEAQVKTATNASGSAPIYSCRAWVNFDGTGTPSIRASGNVSSVSKTATGTYTINFATAMPDANYSVGGSVTWTTNDWGAIFFADASLYSTTQVRVRVATSPTSSALLDTLIGSVQIFR